MPNGKEFGMGSKTRGSGVLLHIASLPSPYGIGDFGAAAYRFADFLARTGQTSWQVLPLNPTDVMGGNSPYFSRSTFAMNPLFIGIDALTAEGLVSEVDLPELPFFPPGRIDFHYAGKTKDVILEKAFRRFKRSPLPDR
jgi:4-alpha-glucanotransferase